MLYYRRSKKAAFEGFGSSLQNFFWLGRLTKKLPPYCAHSFQNFDFLDLSLLNPIAAIHQYWLILIITGYHRRFLSTIRCTGATNYKCFMWLLLPISPSPDPDFWGRDLGTPQLRNSATPHLLRATTATATDVIWYMGMECDVRYAMDVGSLLAGIGAMPSRGWGYCHGLALRCPPNGTLALSGLAIPSRAHLVFLP